MRTMITAVAIIPALVVLGVTGSEIEVNRAQIACL